MEVVDPFMIIMIIGSVSILFYMLYKISRFAFGLNNLLVFGMLAGVAHLMPIVQGILYLACPFLLINTVLYVFLHKTDIAVPINDKYQVSFKTTKGSFKINNIKGAFPLSGRPEVERPKVWSMVF